MDNKTQIREPKASDYTRHMREHRFSSSPPRSSIASSLATPRKLIQRSLFPDRWPDEFVQFVTTA